jgi:hypothetical protein
MPLDLIQASYEHGLVVFRDTSGYVVDVIAPVKFIADVTAAGAQGAGTAATQWAHAAVNSGTFKPPATTGATGGYLIATTGSTDLDDVEVASALCFNAAKGLSLECRVASADVDKTAMAIGFSPVKECAATDVVAVNLSTATVTASVDDGAFAFFDVSATSAYWHGITVNNGTKSSLVTSAVAPADATFVHLKIEVEPTGLATFWANSVLVGGTTTAIRTVSPYNMYCAYVGLMTSGESAANAAYISHFAAWQWSV